MSDISEAYHDYFYGDGDEFIDPSEEKYNNRVENNEESILFDYYNNYGVLKGYYNQHDDPYYLAEDEEVRDSIHKLFLKKLKSETNANDNDLIIFNEFIDKFDLFICDYWYTDLLDGIIKETFVDNVVNIIEEATKINPFALIEYFMKTLPMAETEIKKHKDSRELYNIFDFVGGDDVQIFPNMNIYRKICKWCILASLNKRSFKQILREYKYFQYRTYTGQFSKGLNDEFWNMWHDKPDNLIKINRYQYSYDPITKDLELDVPTIYAMKMNNIVGFGSETPPDEEIPF